MRLGFDFYQQDVLAVARNLLGKHLIRVLNGEKLICKIVETEAYKGPEDKGSHAYGNRRTKRTETMFLPGGFAYVYLIYGMYHMLNVVSAGSNQPQAVLIRAGEPIKGLEIMHANRKLKHNGSHKLLNGPGKLCSAMAIDLNFDGYDLVNGDKLYIESADMPEDDPGFKIVKAKRINIDYAEEYKDKLWRFYIADNPCVSHTN